MPQVRDSKTGRYASGGGSSVGGAASTNPRIQKAKAVGEGATAGAASSPKPAPRFSEDNFVQSRPGVWESKEQGVDAAVIKRDANGNEIGLSKITAPKYEIRQDGDRFKAYVLRMNKGYLFVKSEKSLGKVFNWMNKNIE